MRRGSSGLLTACGVALLPVLVVVIIAAAVGAVAQAASGGLIAPGAASQVTTFRATGLPAGAGWPWGQCTWYVALARTQMGEPVTWGGDAWQWLANASAEGYETRTAPLPGEIAVYRRGGAYSSQDGHVALVLRVTPSSYTVEEANYYGLGIIDTRTIAWPDPGVAGFIL
ncbi:MAG: CHAP domain-containing protein [Chloroflexi bacterium]|nr:MAG: CHAP domain-containing protein [Chloroflexota bacterium]